MPRQASLDAPGTLHHAIVRNDTGRETFVARLGEMAQATSADCPCRR